LAPLEANLVIVILRNELQTRQYVQRNSETNNLTLKR
jgi:hypothetical protein